MTLLILLSISFLSAIALAFAGDRKFAPEINIFGSLATFLAGIALAVQVYMQ